MSETNKLDSLSDPRTGVREDLTTMEYVAQFGAGDEVVELGRCSMELPDEARREWEKLIWRRWLESMTMRGGKDVGK